MVALKDLFKQKNTFLTATHGRAHMSALDATAKHLEKRMSKYLALRPNANLERLLRNLTKSYNEMTHSSHGLPPKIGKLENSKLAFFKNSKFF